MLWTRKVLVFLLFLSPTAGAKAPLNASSWLALVDQANSPFEDAELRVTVRVQKGSTEVERQLHIWQRGDNERRVEMRYPARLAGVSLLVTADGALYSYLPAYRRVRKVVGEQRGDAFMGTDFSLEDLSRLGFSEDFQAQIEREDTESLTLRLSALTPSEHRYPDLRLVVDRTTRLPQTIEHLDTEGQVRRRVSLSDVRSVEGHPFAHSIQLEDLERNRECTATVESITVNQSLTDRLFQVNQLGR